MLRIGGFERRIPLTTLRRRIVPIFIGNGVIANLAANFGNGHLNSVYHRCGLAIGTTGTRQTGDNLNDVSTGGQFNQQKREKYEEEFHTATIATTARQLQS